MKLSRNEWIAVAVTLFVLLFVFGFDPSAEPEQPAVSEVNPQASISSDNVGN